MKRIEITILSLISLAALVFGIAFYQQKQENKHLMDELESTKQQVVEATETIVDIQKEKDYYQRQYKKYLELSEELQNQMGVYEK